MHQKNDRDIRCPFFRNHNAVSICCEAPIPDASARYTFTGEEAQKNKEQHARLFCAGRYKYCEAYRAIIEQYDDNEMD